MFLLQKPVTIDHQIRVLPEQLKKSKSNRRKKKMMPGIKACQASYIPIDPLQLPRTGLKPFFIHGFLW